MSLIRNLLLVVIFAVFVSGCSGLAEMKRTKYIYNANADTALVNIVRPSIFVGDGANVEVWDGDQFIGTLAAGTMIQYFASPGEHTFLSYVQGSWRAINGELKPGKKYYLKFNLGIGLRAAKADDPRIGKWNGGLKHMVIDKEKSKPVPEEEISNAREFFNKVKDGKVKSAPITINNAI